MLAVEKKARAIREEEARKLKEDWVQSQETLRVMRRYGTIEAVNVPAVPVKPVQNEMSTSVEVCLRGDVDLHQPRKLTKKLRAEMFNVDLFAFQNATSLRGRLIGEKGVLSMAADFVRGACPRLQVLDLTGCHIKSRGLGRLLHGLRMGNKTSIRVLILRGNCITSRGVEYLVHNKSLGGLSELEILDLSDNEIDNEGALCFAHAMVKKTFHELQDLNLQNNQISDQGFRSLVTILSSLHDEVCPELHAIHLQQNLITADVKQAYHPLPAYILV